VGHLTHLSDSPIHFDTRSELETLKNVLFASVATAFARNDLPVPGGPYSRMPRHGVRLPAARCQAAASHSIHGGTHQ
jgi:hypothetical protein